MVAVKNVRLIDGTGKGPVENTTILIENGKFKEIGSRAGIPENCSVIDGTGLTAIPGLIDMHTHFGGSASMGDHPGCGNKTETYGYIEAREGFLNWGVTAVRTCGDQAADMLSFRDAANAGIILSPRIKSCGPFIQHPEGHPWATVYFKNEAMKETAVCFADEGATLEEQVDAIADTGVDFIKTFYGHVDVMHYPGSAPRITKEQLKRIADRAHQHGLKCVCHIDGPDEMMEAAQAGVDTIEHIVNLGVTGEIEYTDEIVAAIKESGAVVTPTLVGTYRIQQPFLQDCCAPAKEGVKKLYDAGVTLAVGCDSGIPFITFGDSLHDEMANFVDAGIPAAEVLKMATLGNAQILGMDDQIGSIEAGKDADLVLLGSDPLAEISGTKDIKLVMMRGKIVRDNIG